MPLELVVDSARARQLELEGFLREQVLELRSRAGQHLRMHPSHQRAVVALVEVREAELPGIGAEQRPFLFPIGAVPGKGHVARIGEAPVRSEERRVGKEWRARRWRDQSRYKD